MNYIKQLQADKAVALDSARSIEAAVNPSHFLSSCPNLLGLFRVGVRGTGREWEPRECSPPCASEIGMSVRSFRGTCRKVFRLNYLRS
jgi:hypothetical protein